VLEISALGNEFQVNRLQPASASYALVNACALLNRSKTGAGEMASRLVQGAGLVLGRSLQTGETLHYVVEIVRINIVDCHRGVEVVGDLIGMRQ
jgi:hypothetical protein